MQFQKPATQYVTVAASVTTAPISRTVGSYLESVTIIPGTTASGAVTVLDGTVAILTIPAAAALGQSAPYNLRLGIRAIKPSTDPGFKITTGASVTCLAVGRFSD
jgi:hypothetical protein